MAAMFGFSLGKLLVLAAVIFGVWYGFKYLSRMQYLREERARARDRLNRPEGAPDTPPPGRRPRTRNGFRRRRSEQGRSEQGRGDKDSADMTACPACKAYVPAKGARHCGRPDCPYT